MSDLNRAHVIHEVSADAVALIGSSPTFSDVEALIALNQRFGGGSARSNGSNEVSLASAASACAFRNCNWNSHVGGRVAA